MKENEREVLAHIVQNIDEQEIFMEFIAKAETIKETWQIAKIFETKKKEFKDSIQEYDNLIKNKEQQLKILTNEIDDANNLLKDANAELDALRLQLEEMHSKAQFYKNTIQKDEIVRDSFSNAALDKLDLESNMLDYLTPHY